MQKGINDVKIAFEKYKNTKGNRAPLKGGCDSLDKETVDKLFDRFGEAIFEGDY